MISFKTSRYEKSYEVHVPIAAIAAVMIGEDHVVVKTLDSQSYVVAMADALEILNFFAPNTVKRDA